jgi:hypothetical protein
VGDLWTLDFSSDRRTRFTFRKDVYSPGVWSPDSGRIAYSAGNLGETLYEKASSGVGEETELLKEPGLRHYPTSWSADFRFLLYHTENAPRTGYDLWVLPLQGSRKFGADLTPDGQRFLLAAPQVLRSAPASITMVLNWPALMKK